MGANLQEELQKEKKQGEKEIDLIYPGKYDLKHGSCEVHERISVDMIRNIRAQFNLKKDDPRTAVLVHWECKPAVLLESDFYGSTSAMIQYIKSHTNLEKVYLGTECEMTANLQGEFPQIEFIKTCAIACQHMAKITLDKILSALENEEPVVFVPEDIRKRAIIPIERMLAIS